MGQQSVSVSSCQGGFSLISMLFSLAIMCALLIMFLRVTGMERTGTVTRANCMDTADDVVRQANSRTADLENQINK